jgi:predicted metal-dependent peptidase
VPQVAVVIDTSGSMRLSDLERALGEVRGILRSSSVADDAVTVLTVDATVRGVQKVTRVEDIRLTGRGGTDMSVGIMAALASTPRPDIIVVLTDGYTPWPTQRVRVPVIAGLIGADRHLAVDDRPPAWIRSVDIDD